MSGKRNAVAFEVKDFEALSAAGPGAFMFTTNHGDPDDEPPRGLIHNCPCGCGKVGGLNFAGRRAEPVWTVSGEWPKVTLRPSIGFNKQADGTYHWHGFLTNGVFEEC